MNTLAHALCQAQSRGLERLDAQLLLLHALGRPEHDRAWLLAHDSDELNPVVQAAFETTVQRRLDGEPAAYITGHKEFFGLNLQVDRRVLVPRSDTETLVEWALELMRQFPIRAEPVEALPACPSTGSGRTDGPKIIDLGTGSGAIALALKHSRPDLNVTAVDASVDALTVAQANARRLQLEVDFQQSSWLSQITGRFDLIVSNPPYIAAQDRHLDALRHEPPQALVSGADGLDDLQAIIGQARAHLQPGGWLLLEHGWDQASAVRDLLNQVGLQDVQSKTDLSGIARCSGGHQPAAKVAP